jgi:hypothetical protein
MATRAEILEAAKRNPILAGMVKRGEPLTRDQWIRRAYSLSDMPEPWTPEHEEQVPRVFRKKNPDDAA